MSEELNNAYQTLKQQQATLAFQLRLEPNNLELYKQIDQVNSQLNEVEQALAYDLEAKDKELSAITSNPENFVSYGRFRESILNSPTLRGDYELYTPESRFSKNLTGTPLYDEDKLRDTFIKYNSARESLLNTNRTDSWEDDKNFATKFAVDAFKGAENVIYSTVANLKYGNKEKALQDRFTNLGKDNVEKIQLISKKKETLEKLIKEKQELEDKFVTTHSSMTSLEREALLNRRTNLEAQIASLQLTPEEQALDNSPIKAEYNAIQAEQLALSAEKNAFVNDTVLSNINEEIKPDSETRGALLRELDEEQLARTRAFYGDNYSLIQQVWDEAKLAWKHTTAGQAFGSVLPFIVAGKLGALGMGLSFTATAGSNYYDALAEQYAKDPFKARDEMKAVVGSVISTAVDLWGTKLLIDEPQKLLAKNIIRGSYTEASQKAWKTVEDNINKLGGGYSSKMKYQLYLDEMAKNSPMFVADVSTKLMGSNDSKLRTLGKYLLDMDSKASHLAGKMAVNVDKAIALNNQTLHKLGLGVQDFASSSGSMALENIGTEVASQWAGGTDAKDLLSGESLDSIIKSGVEGVITGGLYHPAGIATNIGIATGSEYLSGLEKYKPVTDKTLNNLLYNTKNLSDEDQLSTIKSTQKSSKELIETLSDLTQKDRDEVENTLSDEKRQAILKTLDVGATPDTAREVVGDFDTDNKLTGFMFGDGEKINLENAPEKTRKYLQNLMNTYNDKIAKKLSYIDKHKAVVDKTQQWLEDKEFGEFHKTVGKTSDNVKDITALELNPTYLEAFSKISKYNQERAIKELVEANASDKDQAEALEKAYKDMLIEGNTIVDPKDLKGSEEVNKEALTKAKSIGFNSQLLKLMDQDQLETLANIDFNNLDKTDFSKFKGTLGFLNKDFIEGKLQNKTIDATDKDKPDVLFKSIKQNSSASKEFFNNTIPTAINKTDEGSKLSPEEKTALAEATKEVLKNTGNFSEADTVVNSIFDKYVETNPNTIEARKNSIKQATQQLYDNLTLGTLKDFITEWNESRMADAISIKDGESKETVVNEQKTRLKKKGVDKLVEVRKGIFTNTVYFKKIDDGSKAFKEQVNKQIEEFKELLKKKKEDEAKEVLLGVAKQLVDKTQTLLEENNSVDFDESKVQAFHKYTQEKALKGLLNSGKLGEKDTKGLAPEDKIMQLTYFYYKIFQDTVDKANEVKLEEAGFSSSTFHGYDQISSEIAKNALFKKIEELNEKAEKDYKERMDTEFYKQEGRNFKDFQDIKGVRTLMERLFSGIIDNKGISLLSSEDVLDLSNPKDTLSKLNSYYITAQTQLDLPVLRTHLEYVKHLENNNTVSTTEIDGYIKFIRNLDRATNSNHIHVLSEGTSAFATSSTGITNTPKEQADLEGKLKILMNVLDSVEDKLGNSTISDSVNVADLITNAKLASPIKEHINSLSSLVLSIATDSFVSAWNTENNADNPDSLTNKLKENTTWVNTVNKLHLGEFLSLVGSADKKKTRIAEIVATELPEGSKAKALLEQGLRDPSTTVTEDAGFTDRLINSPSEDRFEILTDLLGSYTVQRFLGLVPLPGKLLNRAKSTNLEGFVEALKDSSNYSLFVRNNNSNLAEKSDLNQTSTSKNIHENISDIVKNIDDSVGITPEQQNLLQQIIITKMYTTSAKKGSTMSYFANYNLLRDLSEYSFTPIPGLSQGDSKYVLDTIFDAFNDLVKSDNQIPTTEKLLGKLKTDSKFTDLQTETQKKVEHLLTQSYKGIKFSALLHNLHKQMETEKFSTFGDYNKWLKSKQKELITLSNAGRDLYKPTTPFSKYDPNIWDTQAQYGENVAYNPEDIIDILQRGVIPTLNFDEFKSNKDFKTITDWYEYRGQELKNNGDNTFERGCKLLNEVIDTGEVIRSYTQEDANAIGRILFGVAPDSDTQLLKNLQVFNTSEPTSPEIGGVADFSKRETSSLAYSNNNAKNIFRGKACYGSNHSVDEIATQAGNPEIFNHIRTMASNMRFGVNYTTLPSIQRYFSTVLGENNPRLFEAIAGITIANLSRLASKTQDEDFLNRLDPALANMYEKHNLQNAGKLNSDLGAIIVEALGIKSSPDIERELIADLGALGLYGLHSLNLAEVKYAGLVNGKPKLVDVSASGSAKEGKTCTVKFNPTKVAEVVELVKNTEYQKQVYEYKKDKNGITTRTPTKDKTVTSNVIEDAYTSLRNKDFRALTKEDLIARNNDLATDFPVSTQTFTSVISTNELSITVNEDAGIMEVRIPNGVKAGEYAKLADTIRKALDIGENQDAVFYVPKHVYTKPDGTRLTSGRVLTVVNDILTPKKLLRDSFNADFGFLQGVDKDSILNKLFDNKYDDMSLDGAKKDDLTVLLLRKAIEYEPIERIGSPLSYKRLSYRNKAIELIDSFNELQSSKYDKEVYYNSINTVNNRVYVEARTGNYRELKPLRQYFAIGGTVDANGKHELKISADDTVTRAITKATFLANLGLKYDKMTLQQIDDAYKVICKTLKLNTIPSKSTTQEIFTHIDKINELLKNEIYTYRGDTGIAEKPIQISSNMEAIRAIKTFMNNPDQFVNLQQNKSANFDDFYLRLEVDGLCNGASLKRMGSEKLGADSRLDQAIGVYITSNRDNAFFASTDASEVQDLYGNGKIEAIQNMAEAVVGDILKNGTSSGSIEFLPFLSALFGTEVSDIDGLQDVITRDLIKPPFIAENYNAGEDAINAKFQRDLTDKVSELLYHAIYDKDTTGKQKFLRWVQQACEFNNSESITFTNFKDNTVLYVTKEGKIIDSQFGSTNLTENTIYNNPELLMDYEFTPEIDTNKVLAKNFRELFVKPIYDGIDKLRQESGKASDIYTATGNACSVTIAKLVHKKLAEIGIFDTGITDKAIISATIKDALKLINPVIEIGYDKTKMSLVRNRIADAVTNDIEGHLVKSTDGKFIYKPKAPGLNYTSAGSAIPPTITHASDGNIIQAVASGLDSVPFLGVHDALIILPEHAQKGGEAINKQTFLETIQGTNRTLNSSIEILNRCIQVAKTNRVSLPADVFQTLQKANNYTQEYRLTMVDKLTSWRSLLATSNGAKKIYYNQYQFTGLTAYELTEEDLKNASEELISSGVHHTINSDDLDSLYRILTSDVLTNSKIVNSYFEDNQIHTLKDKFKELLSTKSVDDIFNTIIKDIDISRELGNLSKEKKTEIKEKLYELKKEIKARKTDSFFNEILSAYTQTQFTNVTENRYTNAVIKFKEISNNYSDKPDNYDDNTQLYNNFQRVLGSTAGLLPSIENNSLAEAVVMQGISNDGIPPQTEFLQTLQDIGASSDTSTDLFDGVITDPNAIDKGKPVYISVSEIDFKDLRAELETQALENAQINVFKSDSFKPNYQAWWSDYRTKVFEQYKNKQGTLVLTMRNQEDILLLKAFQDIKKANSTYLSGLKILIAPGVNNTTFSVNNKSVAKMNLVDNHVRAILNIKNTIAKNNLKTEFVVQASLARNKFKNKALLEFITGQQFNESTLGAKIIAPSTTYYYDKNLRKVQLEETGKIWRGFTTEYYRTSADYLTNTSVTPESFNVADLLTKPIRSGFSNVSIDELTTKYFNPRGGVEQVPIKDLSEDQIKELIHKNYEDIVNHQIQIRQDGQTLTLTDIHRLYKDKAGIGITDTIAQLANPDSTFVIRTSTSGRILDKRTSALFGENGISHLVQAKKSYDKQLAMRKQKFKQGLISEEELKLPIYAKVNTLGMGTTEVMFVPYIDDTIHINDLRNAIHLTVTHENGKATNRYSVERTPELVRVFEADLFVNEKMLGYLYNQAHNPNISSNILLFADELGGVGQTQSMQRYIKRATTRHVSMDNTVACKSVLYANALYDLAGLGGRTFYYLDSFNDVLQENSNNETTTLPSLGRRLHIVDIGQANLNQMKWVVSSAKNTLSKLFTKKTYLDNTSTTHGYNKDSNTLAQTIKEDKLALMDRSKLNTILDKLIEADLNNGIDSSWLRESLGAKLLNLVQPLKLAITSTSKLGGVSYTKNGTSHAVLGIPATPTGSTVELLFHEALVHPVMEFIDKDANSQRKSAQLYQYVMTNIKPEMFDCELPHAKEILDYIQSKKGSEAIAEFFAYAVTNADFRNAISKLKPNQEISKGIFARIEGVFNKFLNRIFDVGKSINTQPTDVIQTVDNVFDSIYRAFNSAKQVELNYDNKTIDAKLALLEKADDVLFDKTVAVLDTINKSYGTLLTTTRAKHKADEISGKNVIATPGDTIINHAEKLANIVAKFTGHSEDISKYLGEVFTSLKGTTEDNWDYIKLRLSAKQSIDVARQACCQYVNEMTKELIKDFEPRVKNQLTRFMVRTDVSALFDPKNQVNKTDALKVIKDSKFRKEQIAYYERRLKSIAPKYGNYLINASKGLSDYMCTGINSSGLGYKNAYEITHMVGSLYPQTLAPTIAQNDVDVLATLYSIDYMDKELGDIYSQLPDEFIEKFSELHNAIKDFEYQNTYGNYDQKNHIPKGQVHGGHSVGQVQVYSAKHTKALEWASSFGTEITKPRLDPFFKSRNANLVQVYFPFRSAIPVEAGVFALTDLFNNRVGSGIRADNRAISYDNIAITNMKDVNGYISHRINELNSTNSKLIDPSSVDGNFSLLYDVNGKVTGANFEINPQVADRKMKHHYKINNVLGDIFGSAMERYKSSNINVQSAQAIADIYESNKLNKNKKFVWINENSEVEEYRQAYENLPFEVKEFFRKEYPSRGMPVLEGTLNLIMGKRVTSAKELDTEYYVNPKLAKEFKSRLLHYFRNGWVALGEEGANYLTKVGKDFLVVKSLSVGINNYISNYISLALKGIKPNTILVDMMEGLNQIQQINKYSTQLGELNKRLLLNKNDTEAFRQKQIILNATKSLPIYSLYKDGIIGTIAEDLSDSDRLIKDLIDTYLPTNVAKIAHEFAIDQASHIYKFLRDFVNVGDKLGKYVLYKHLPDTLSKDQKYRELQDTFVDYGIPLPTGLDWIEATGMANFMKYGFGIQKTILNTATKAPSATLATALASSGILGTHTPTILDSILTFGTLNQGLGVPGIDIWLSGVSESPYARVGNLL